MNCQQCTSSSYHTDVQWLCVETCFNVHYDLRDDGNAVRFRELLQSFGFIQHVTEPTHARGHALDLVITKSETGVLSLHVGGMISDHALIGFVLPRKKPIAKAHWVTC